MEFLNQQMKENLGSVFFLPEASDWHAVHVGQVSKMGRGKKKGRECGGWRGGRPRDGLNNRAAESDHFVCGKARIVWTKPKWAGCLTAGWGEVKVPLTQAAERPGVRRAKAQRAAGKLLVSAGWPPVV